VARWAKGLMVICRHWCDVEMLASFDDHGGGYRPHAC
jgi:hypothetical protein